MTDAGRLLVIAAPPGAPSARAVEVLAAASAVWAEDGDRVADLLDAVRVPGPARHRLPADSTGATVVAAVAGGATVALVTATPGSSAAVAAVVAAVLAADLPVEVVPAAVPAVAALVASGLATARTAVDPPLPRVGPARAERLARLGRQRRTTALPVMADALGADLADLAAVCGPGREVAVAGDGGRAGVLWRGSAGAAAAWAAGAEVGDAVLVVVDGVGDAGDEAGEAVSDEAVRADLRAARRRGLSPGRAAAEVAAATGRPRREVYALGAAEEEP